MSDLAFQYQAIDRHGQRSRGVVRAQNLNDAYRLVRAAGLQPVRIKAARLLASRRRKVSVKDLAHFTHQFAVLMEARIPIVDGLRSIAEQEPNARLRMIVNEIADRIAAGGGVTEALTAHRELFGEVYVEIIRSAERSGNLIEVLHLLAEMLERQDERSKSVRSALMYPGCVIVALTLATAFLMIVVVPRFASMFASRGVELPMPTQMLLAFSTFIQTWWYALLAGALAIAVTIHRARTNRRWRAWLDVRLHHVPYLRDMLRGLGISRFATVLGLSLRSGLSLIEALDMAGRASGRPLLANDAARMRDQVNHGGRLADVLMACTYLPAFTRRMLTAGEEAGELSRMCSVVARHYDREVAYLTKNVSTLIEPILIVGLAGVVLVVALAIFLPMWNMAALIG